MTRKSKPWAVIVNVPGQPTRTEHTSEAKAYEKVRETVDAVRAGTAQATRIRIEKWDAQYGAWECYDRINPQEQW